MDKLSPASKAELKKISDVRLTAKLSQAGVSAEQLEIFDRKGMLDMWGEITLAGHDTKPVASTAMVEYNVELEKQKFEFEIRKFEQEKEERKKPFEEEQKRKDGEQEERK